MRREDCEISLYGLTLQHYAFLAQSRGAGPSHLSDEGDNNDDVEMKLHSVGRACQPE